MYKEVQCIMKISPLLIPSVDHSEVFEMKGEFQVKGRKRDILFPLLFSQFDIQMDVFFPPFNCCLLIMFVSSQCAFGVAVPDWPKSTGDVSVRGEEDWPMGGADGSGRGSQDGVAERRALQ